MKLTRKHAVTGLAAAGLLAGALTAGAVALASSSPASAAATTAAASTGPGTGNCGRGYAMWSGQPSVMTAAADYLGLSLAQLRAQLHAGSSLAGIAAAQGKSVSGLKDAILAAMTSRVNADTALTAKQKTAMISQLKSRLDTMINTDMGYWADTGTGAGMGSHMTGTGSPMGGMRS